MQRFILSKDIAKYMCHDAKNCSLFKRGNFDHIYLKHLVRFIIVIL